MKPGILSFFAGMLLSVSVYAQTPSEAIEYMDNMYEFMDKLKTEQWQYLKALTRSKGARKVEARRQDLLEEIRNAKANLVIKKAFYKNIDLKSSLISHLDLTYKVLNEDYSKILDMEEIAEQSYDLMEAYLLAKEKASEKLGQSYEMVQKAERTFAEKYNVNLIEGEGDRLSEKIKKAGEVLEYYNDVYLVFFKAYKQEVYVMDALKRNDLNALEQNISTLKSDSEEGLAKLNEIGNFKTDRSLKMVAIRSMQFYQKECDFYFQEMVDFYLKKDNFEKMRESIEAKKKKDRTRQDVDKFNKAAKDYNEAVARYNTAIENSNKERSKMLDDWNKTAEDFMESNSK